MAVAIDEPITVAGVANPHGATVLPLKAYLAERRRRNRSPKTREHLEHVIAVSEAHRASFTDPPPENQTLTGWRSKLAALPEGKRAKAAAKRQAPLTAEAQVREIRRRREAAEREAAALRSEALSLFKAGKVGATALGEALGVKRQRVYQLAAD